MPKARETLIELIRVAFAVGFALYLFEFRRAAFLSNDPGPMIVYTTVTLVLCAFLAVGFLTPICLLLMAVGCHGWFAGAIGWNLNHAFAAWLCWALLFLGAGNRYSVDWWLGYRRQSADPDRVAKAIGFSMGITFFLGAWIHFADPLWRRGEALGWLLTDPFYNPHGEFFSVLFERFPFLVKAFTYLQLGFETLFLPLSLFRRGRWILIPLGLVFFAGAQFLIQASYVGFLGFLIWALFYFPSSERGVSPGFLWFSRVSRSVGLTYLLLSVLSFSLGGGFASHMLRTSLMVNASRVFGLAAPDVYNGDHLKAGELFFTVEGRDGLVPYLGRRGERLSLLRSQPAYFDFFGNWYSLPISSRLKNPSGNTRSVVTHALRLAGLSEDEAVVELLRRSRLADPPRWGKPERIARWTAVSPETEIYLP